MSTIGGGSSTADGYNNLAALIEFVKSPDYMKRLAELRDLEDSSRSAFDAAQAAKAEAEAAMKTLASEKAAHDAAARELFLDRQAHERRVALWRKAMDGVNKALRGED